MSTFPVPFSGLTRRLRRDTALLAGTAPGRTIALVLFANVFVVVLSVISLHASYRQYQDRAAVSSRNTDRLVAQTIAGEIERIDYGLTAAVDEYTRLRALGRVDVAAMDAFLARQRERLPMVDAVRASDATGAVIYDDGNPHVQGVDVTDRDYFQALRDHPDTGLAISKPLLGRVSNKSVVIFAKRLSGPRGEFEGVVLAPVTLEWFQRKFLELELGPHGAVVLRGDASRDFDLLTRFPEAGFVGQTNVSDTFRATVAASPHGGTYEARAGADGILRTFSYQAVEGYPLITLVGLATDDVLAGWWREVAKMVVLVAVFITASVWSGWELVRMLRSLQRQAEDLARSNSELEQFAYVASHDLQTPLRNIASYAQLLERRYGNSLGADADDYIGFIVDGAKRMSSMISDLLDFARITGGSGPAVPVEANSSAAIVLARLKKPIADCGASVTVERLPVVQVHPTQLERLLQNLVENALQYRDPGRKAEIHIGTQPEEDGMCRMYVRDNGIGIEADYFEKIFIIFQRLDPRRFPDGTGIGLAACRRIVSQHGGRIWVESQPGKGTTFWFTLPAAHLPQARKVPVTV